MKRDWIFHLVTSRIHHRTLPAALLAGSAMGTAVWPIGHAGLLPAARLTPPILRQGARHVAVSLLGHVAFGILGAIRILLLERKGMREPSWRRAPRRIVR